MSPAPDLRRLLAPTRVAIVGSTSKPTGLGSRTMRHLRDAGFAGDVTPYATGDQVPEGTDVAVIAVPAAAVQQVLDDIGSRVAFAVVYSSGFEEVGRAALRTSPGVRLLGPNTVGLYCAPSRTVLTFAQAFDDVPVGGPGSGVFLVSQSGAFGARLVRSAYRYGLHLDGFVGTGNEADLDACTVACGLIDSAGAVTGSGAVRAILLYLEGLRSPDNLVELLARARDAGVAVVALLGGLSEAGAMAATSHTSAVSSDHAVVAELFAFYGAALVHTDRDLVQAAIGISLLGRRPARRVGVVTGSGGAGVVAADILTGHGLVLPELSPALRAQVAAHLPDIASTRNPVDVTAQTIGDNAILAKVCTTLRDSGEVDLLLVVGREDQAVTAGAVAGAAVPTVVAVLDRDASGVRPRIEQGEVVLPDLAAACTALAAVAAPERAEGDLAPPWPTVTRSDAGTLTAAASLELVAGSGVATAPWRLATTVDEVLGHGDALGWPVVLKSNVDASVHKARGGHVRLDVYREQAAELAAAMLRDTSEVIVARQLRASLELFAGVRRDPHWGLVVSAGLGGANIELLDTTVAMPARLPVTWLARRLAERIFDRVPGRYEGLADQLAAAAGALVELAASGGYDLVECNPIGVVDGRLVALDARVVA